MRQPNEVAKIDNETIQFTHWNPGVGYSKQTLKVTRIETRDAAIELCKRITMVELSKKTAFDNLHKFKNNFSRHRNYEIEDYLAQLTGDFTYRIVEICQINGFSWFD